MAERLPLETQTLYAELLEHLIGMQAQRSIGGLTGSFTEKVIKGEPYLYWQASHPGGRTKQFYVGRRTPDLERALERLQRRQTEMAPDLERVQRLAAQLRVGGASVADHPSARVVQALAESGLFDAGAVLVGTHAFAVLGVEVRDLIVMEGGVRLGLTSGGGGRRAVGIRSSDTGKAVSRTPRSGT